MNCLNYLYSSFDRFFINEQERNTFPISLLDESEDSPYGVDKIYS